MILNLIIQMKYKKLLLNFSKLNTQSYLKSGEISAIGADVKRHKALIFYKNHLTHEFLKKKTQNQGGNGLKSRIDFALFHYQSLCVRECVFF